MIHAITPIDDTEIARALDDVASDIAELRVVTKRMMAPLGGPSFEADQAYLTELTERIASRARRVEIGGVELCADDLLRFANALDRGRSIASAVSADDARTILQDYRAAIEHETACIRSHTEAEQDLRVARSLRAAAERRYRAYCAVRLEPADA